MTGRSKTCEYDEEELMLGIHNLDLLTDDYEIVYVKVRNWTKVLSNTDRFKNSMHPTALGLNLVPLNTLEFRGELEPPSATIYQKPR